LNGWLLDTNIASELRKPKPDHRVTAFVENQPQDALFISSVSLAELRYGIEILPDPARRAELRLWLNTVIRPIFTGHVLSADEAVMLEWRVLMQYGRKINLLSPSQTSSSPPRR